METSVIRKLLRRAWKACGPFRPHVPVNLRRFDVSEAAIAADVQYAIRIGEEYVELIRATGGKLAGLGVLELGPGVNFGAALVLACHGVSVSVADRFLAPWQEPYHPLFYRGLHASLAGSGRALDLAPLERVIAGGGYPPGEPTRIEAGAQALIGIADERFDCVLSNAVLEHVLGLRQVVAELLRVTKPSGLGIHQVDFRDHRDFTAPLEHLLLDETRFREMFVSCHGECGSQTRHDELLRHFAAGGFAILRFEGNMFAEHAYLEQFIPRLRQSGSRYRDTSREILRVISGRVFVGKPA